MRDNSLMSVEPRLPSDPIPAAPEPTAGLVLIAAGRMLRSRVEDELAEHGIGLRHLAALGHLSHEPGLSFTELARRASITVQSVQATLLQLENLKAVERGTAPGRGRKAQLHVTPAGAQLLVGGMRCITRIEDQMLQGVDAAQRPVFVELLLQVITNLRTGQEPEPPSGQGSTRDGRRTGTAASQPAAVG